MLSRLLDSRTLSRTCLAATFIVGGIGALRGSRDLRARAQTVTDPLTDAAGVDVQAERLVQVNAGAQIAGGALLALGILPRIASLVLAASIVPTTLAGHRFWEEHDADSKRAQLMQFSKNAAIFGGLLSAALDTGGRPSVFWSGRQKLADATATVTETVERLTPAA